LSFCPREVTGVHLKEQVATLNTTWYTVKMILKIALPVEASRTESQRKGAIWRE
jgi:hypothetical protein